MRGRVLAQAPRWGGWHHAIARELRPLVIFGTVCVVMSAVFYVGQLGPGPKEFIDTWLRAYPTKPWTIVTAMFVHFEIGHFLANLVGLLGFLGLFVLANWSFELMAGRRVSFPLSVIFGSATVANLVNVKIIPAPLPGSSPFGASGIVYGLIGTTIGLALVNSFWYVRLLWTSEKPTRLIRVLFFINLLLSSLLLFLLYPAVFFGLGVSNALGHVVSFLGGLLVAMLIGFRLVDVRPHRNGPD